ncbi:fimbria/pilus periplasmic chaperone [Sphingomonas sp.]|uniref:fimbrial biogenesis chaperone n=1 Tax=Sphingomonas sp. TaxID=28214 RepID=UPI0025D2F879|nr:fimbria/pilus periplasmic chaperone [Sphingomonas sp.]MBV9527532.1 fimbria/pilus periplasmic chaperone [Sphingomonas sp.]
MKLSLHSAIGTIVAAPLLAAATPAAAGIGDLLVAPTRIVLDGRKGAEVILNNIGDEPATYRVSVEFRRMTEDGNLVDVTEPTADDKAAEDMIVYAPRRVTLAPHQPQSIRIAARAPAGLADGEYRVHMLFRAIPPATPVAPTPANSDGSGKGVHFQLIPVYGVTIPVIVRLGNLQATAGIANVRFDKVQGKPVVDLDLSRSGARSTFGDVKVLKAGVKDPIAIQKAVAVYKEVGVRHLSVPLDGAFQGDPRGPVTVQYVETFDDGSHVLAQTDAVLR